MAVHLLLFIRKESMKMFYHKVLAFTLSCSVFSLCASESLYKEVLSATPIRESIPAHDIVLSKKLTNLIVRQQFFKEYRVMSMLILSHLIKTVR